MATIHDIRRVSPRQHSGAELSRIVGDPDAAFRRDNIVDFERHRMSRVYRRMCAELDNRPADLNAWLNRPAERIEPEPRVPLWFRIYIAVALVVSVGVWFL